VGDDRATARRPRGGSGDGERGGGRGLRYIRASVRPDTPFRPAAIPFFYGWVILAATTLGMLSSIPGQTMGVSVFTDRLIEATGLSRVALSNAYLIGTVASGLSLAMGGAWIDRFGARRVVGATCLGLAGTLLYLSGVDRLAAGLGAGLGLASSKQVAWVLLVLGFTALRFFGQGMLGLVSRTTLARWFDRRRGLVSAIQGAFVSLGFAAAPLGLHLWIEAAGWRGAWQGMALAVGLGMGLVGVLLYRTDPEECGLRPDGAAPEVGSEQEAAPATPRAVAAGSSGAGVPPAPRGLRDFTRGEAIRTAAFWIVAIGIAAHAMVGTGLTFHIVDLGAEGGLSQAEAVAIFLPIALLGTPVAFLVGAAVDRYPVYALMMAMMAAQVAMYAGMAHMGDPMGRAVAIAGWGISQGFYGPLTVAALPKLFGRGHLGAIQGAHMTILVVASAFGPAVLAAFQGLFGAYRPGLYLLCGIPVALLAAAFATRRSDARG